MWNRTNWTQIANIRSRTYHSGRIAFLTSWILWILCRVIQSLFFSDCGSFLKLKNKFYSFSLCIFKREYFGPMGSSFAFDHELFVYFPPFASIIFLSIWSIALIWKINSVRINKLSVNTAFLFLLEHENVNVTRVLLEAWAEPNIVTFDKSYLNPKMNFNVRIVV